MSKSCIIRVRLPSGMKRLAFSTKDPTWGDVQKKYINIEQCCDDFRDTACTIQEQLGTPIDQQLISRNALHDPDFIETSPSTKLSAIGLRHGDIIYPAVDDGDVKMTSAASTPIARSKPKVKDHRTPRCQHPPNGRCVHCSGTMPGTTQKPRCNHGRGIKCPNCSHHVQDADAPPAEWLCTHGPDSFCPKCLPPEEEEDENGKSRLCTCVKGQKCIYCAKSGPKIKVDMIPYRQMMNEKRKQCQHSPNTTCPFCADVPLVSYAGDPSCTGNGSHAPWPKGICSRCMPPNAVLRPQKYRHVDGISFTDSQCMAKFVGEWQQNPGLQRCCLLYGQFVDEPTSTQNIGAVRAEVQAIYVPPQQNLHDGVRLRKDPHKKSVTEVARACGLECVGWAITTLPRDDDKYGGEMLMSGPEIRQAAKFQLEYSNEFSHSKFVTVIVKHNKQGQIEPTAYQVSDQAVAMQRDGLLGDASDVGFLAARKAKKTECLPTIVYKNKPLQQGEEFLPDELLVKVIPMQPHKPKPLFKFIAFPIANANDDHLRGHLRNTRLDPYHVKFSDFGLLSWIPRKAGLELTKKLARSVVANKPVDNATGSELDLKLAEYLS